MNYQHEFIMIYQFVCVMMSQGDEFIMFILHVYSNANVLYKRGMMCMHVLDRLNNKTGLI